MNFDTDTARKFAFKRFNKEFLGYHRWMQDNNETTLTGPYT